MSRIIFAKNMIFYSKMNNFFNESDTLINKNGNKVFLGVDGMGEYFYGRYYKIQDANFSVSFIPAVFGTTEKSCMIQVVLPDRSVSVEYNVSCFFKKGNTLYLGDSIFSGNKAVLNIMSENISVSGEISFENNVLLKRDIMGPFRYVPFMQCRHKVYSMLSNADGSIELSDRKIYLNNAKAYIEGDSGREFPQRYIWTQCIFENNSLMLSVADIPYSKINFTGVICAIYYNKKHYRIATYNGNVKTEIGKNNVTVSMGKYSFSAELISKKCSNLFAPQNSGMQRIIRESLCCKAKYRFTESGKTVFEFETNRASFEFEY